MFELLQQLVAIVVWRHWLEILLLPFAASSFPLFHRLFVSSSSIHHHYVGLVSY